MRKAHKGLLIILLTGLGMRVFISCYNSFYQLFFADDAFYYFKIARNISAGLGITYDGVQHTNGFQPLFLFLITPLFSITGKSITLPLHLVALLQSLISIGIGIFLYKTSRAIVDEWYALFIVAIWMLSPIVVDKELNGMETGLNLFLIVATVYYYSSPCEYHLSPLRFSKLSTLGLLLGLVVLSRLDGLILVGVIAIHFSYSIVRKAKGVEDFKRLATSVVCVIGVVFLLVVPWLIFNYQVAGSIIPTSGQAVRYMSQNYGFAFFNFRFGTTQSSDLLYHIPIKFYLENVFFSFTKVLLHLPYTSYVTRASYDFLLTHEGTSLLAKGVVRTLASLALASLFFLLLKFLPRSSRIWKLLLVYSMLLIGAYSCYAFGQWFYHRYYFVIALMGTIWGGYLLYSIDLRLPRSFFIPTLFKVLTLILFLSLSLLQWRQVVSDRHKNQNLLLHTMVKVAEQTIPQGSVIGCFQSGIIGYYSDRKVINLDGVVNLEALRAIKENRMGEYVSREGISYIMDWSFVLDTLFFRHLGEYKSLLEFTPVHKGFFHIYKIGYQSTPGNDE